ncbi:MAG: glycosyltransferase family 4 protein [Acidobacteria bacterium]|nr:glycosyltransferase family 4 protein [Acidobacteriota bacterium]
MKICFCKGIFFGPVSGPDEQIINYASNLKKAGHKPSVLVVCSFARTDPYYVRFRDAGVAVSSIGQHPLYIIFLVVRQIALLFPIAAIFSKFHKWETLAYWTAVFYFRWHKPDIIHVIVEGGIVIRAAHKARIPIIYHESATPWYSPQVESYYKALTNSLPICNRVAALSPLHAKLCRELLPYKGPISIIPLIIADPGKHTRVADRSQGAVTFGFAARLEHLKGPTILLEAFAQLVQRNPNARLIMAGKGDDEEAVFKLAEKLGIAEHCSFPGAYSGQEEKSAFMQSIDVFVLPSFAESVSIGVIEAMAHSLPVIASDVGAISDEVTATTGILVPPGSVSALATAMLQLAENVNIRKQMGLDARKRYEQYFSPEAVLPLLLRNYKEVANVDRELLNLALDKEYFAHPWM